MHTPGPWKAEGWEKVVVNSAENDTIVSCPGGSWRASLSEIKANARLIAAAPDLLAALKAIVNARDSAALADDPACHFIDQAIEAGRAAIAKTEGGAA